MRSLEQGINHLLDLLPACRKPLENTVLVLLPVADSAELAVHIRAELGPIVRVRDRLEAAPEELLVEYSLEDLDAI